MPPEQQHVQRCNPCDLREGRWEHYHAIRYVPLHEGVEEDVVIFPMGISQVEAHHRLGTVRVRQVVWHIVALNHSTWVIISVPLPDKILTDLKEPDVFRNEEKERLAAAQGREDAHGESGGDVSVELYAVGKGELFT